MRREGPGHRNGQHHELQVRRNPPSHTARRHRLSGGQVSSRLPGLRPVPEDIMLKREREREESFA